MTALARALTDIASRKTDSDRRARRYAAERYARSGRQLEYWMFKRTESRLARFDAVHRPGDPIATKRLCRALYADWQAALNMARHLQFGQRAEELRTLFTCECEQYRQQTRMRSAAE